VTVTLDYLYIKNGLNPFNAGLILRHLSGWPSVKKKTNSYLSLCSHTIAFR